MSKFVSQSYLFLTKLDKLIMLDSFKECLVSEFIKKYKVVL